MDAFRVWLMGLMAVALILTVLSSVLPEGSVKKIAGVTGGLVLLMVILQGAERLDLGKLQLSYDDYSRQINEQIKAFQEKNSRDMDLLIQERCSAYISESLTCANWPRPPVWRTKRVSTVAGLVMVSL